MRGPRRRIRPACGLGYRIVCHISREVGDVSLSMLVGEVDGRERSEWYLP